MGQTYAMVLAHLEHEQPDEFERLKSERQLRKTVEARVHEIYAEADRVQARLRATYPKMSDDQLRLEAEQLAIAALLPTKED